MAQAAVHHHAEVAPTVLRVSDLSVSFRGGAVKAVRNVSFEVNEGETLGIVGESGSGKSVTGLALMRLLAPQARIEGLLELVRRDGAAVSLADLSAGQMRAVRGKDIAMVFQEPMTSLNPVHRVGDQIVEAILQHRRISRDEARTAMIALLREVGIPDPEIRKRAFPHELSGGMRQRVMIAMALSCQPRLIIADEPTTALDVTIQAQIVDLLRKLQAARGTAMIFVTHDLPLIRHVADRVAVMYAGEIVEQGPVEEVFADPRHPYTWALLNSAPHLGQRRSDRRIEAIAGTAPSPANQPPGCRFHPRCRHFRPGQCDVADISLETINPDRATRCLFWRELGMETSA